MKKLGLFLLAVAVLFGVFATAQAQALHPSTTAVLYVDSRPSELMSKYSILGPPTISASHINAVLAAYGPPVAGLGQFIFDRGRHYGIDPIHVLDLRPR